MSRSERMPATVSPSSLTTSAPMPRCRSTAAARFTLLLGQLGTVRTRTLKAFPEAAYREIIHSLR